MVETSFLEFYLVYNGNYLKLLGSLLQNLGDFASLCIKIGGDFGSQLSKFRAPSTSFLFTFHIRKGTISD